MIPKCGFSFSATNTSQVKLPESWVGLFYNPFWKGTWRFVFKSKSSESMASWATLSSTQSRSVLRGSSTSWNNSGRSCVHKRWQIQLFKSHCTFLNGCCSGSWHVHHCCQETHDTVQVCGWQNSLSTVKETCQRKIFRLKFFKLLSIDFFCLIYNPFKGWTRYFPHTYFLFLFC